jgi:hypothetical protein
MAFINSFLGIFSTSYLIIEEKNNGTLLALLTSPLTASELLMGKFLFNVILCGLFSFMVILSQWTARGFDLSTSFGQHLSFCWDHLFCRLSSGSFFKNEQEMSFLLPYSCCFFVLVIRPISYQQKRVFSHFFPIIICCKW